MPKGPKGQKRPGDVIGAAVKVMRIATGQETEVTAELRNAAAQLGSRGGKARSEKLTAKQRSQIAHEAATARWKKKS